MLSLTGEACLSAVAESEHLPLDPTGQQAGYGKGSQVIKQNTPAVKELIQNQAMQLRDAQRESSFYSTQSYLLRDVASWLCKLVMSSWRSLRISSSSLHEHKGKCSNMSV